MSLAGPGRVAILAAVAVDLAQLVPVVVAGPVGHATIVLWSLGAVVYGLTLWAVLRRARPRGGRLALLGSLAGALAEVAWLGAACALYFASPEQGGWAVGAALGRFATFWIALVVGALVVVGARRRGHPEGPRRVGP